MQLSVIVPFHRNRAHLRRCLTALTVAGAALPRGVVLREIVVVADGPPHDPTDVATASGATVLVIDGPSGPAVARNRGAAITSGEILVFVDSDVVVGTQSLARLAEWLAADPDLTAVFGAYDQGPAEPAFFSRGKNLAHSFVHHRCAGEARTFWAGLGAVRADVFARLGGFDERFVRPSVEDIDLGYRISASGGRIRLDPAIQGQHLKRWTFRGTIVTDIRDRGIPWTQLLHRYGGLHNDLNLSVSYRACVIVSYLLAGCLLAAVWQPILLAVAPFAILALWLLDRSYYRFFAGREGLAYVLAWFPVHLLHHLCNGLSFIVGTVLYVGKRWGGISLPEALPLSPWRGNASLPRNPERTEHLARS
jgi:GT2 family glycosyltransferase